MQNITPASGIDHVQFLKSSALVRSISKTLDATSVSTVDSDGNKYLNTGVVLAAINTPAAASGLVGPYSGSATDGRQLDQNIVGINNTFSNLTDGDKEVGVVIEAVVKRDQIVMGGAKGAVSQEQVDLLRNSRLDIRFDK